MVQNGLFAFSQGLRWIWWALVLQILLLALCHHLPHVIQQFFSCFCQHMLIFSSFITSNSSWAFLPYPTLACPLKSFSTFLWGHLSLLSPSVYLFLLLELSQELSDCPCRLSATLIWFSVCSGAWRRQNFEISRATGQNHLLHGSYFSSSWTGQSPLCWNLGGYSGVQRLFLPSSLLPKSFPPLHDP